MCSAISPAERQTKDGRFSPSQLEAHHKSSILELSYEPRVFLGIIEVLDSLSLCQISPRTATQLKSRDSFQSSPFSKLSIETIQHIAKVLPLSSASSFTHSCRTLALIIGNQYWRKLRVLEGPRLIFCQMLGRDIPDHIFCYRCRILHRLGRYDAPCMRDQIRHGSLHIVFPEFQMAMKQHRLGLGAKDYLDQLAATLTEVRKGYTYHSVTAARIVSSNLLVRTRHLFLFPRSVQCFPRDKGTAICAHLVYDPKRPYCCPDRLGALLQCRMRHWEDAKACPLDICVGMKKCFYCHTEIEIDVNQSDSGVAVVVTAWREFGSGLAAEEIGLRSKWRNHSGLSVNLFDRQRQEAKFTAGSIRSRFERAKRSPGSI
jgi:hypothetical protein